MSSVQPLEIVGRVVTVLRNLNAFDGVTISELARLSGLSRGAVNRYIVTLVELGYAVCDPLTRKYSVTPKVLELSTGAASDDWVTTIVRPHLIATCRKNGWPASLGTLRHGKLTVVENTDAESVLIVYPMREHMVVPPVGRAAGHVLLAFKSEEVCNDILVVALANDPKLFSRAQYDRSQFKGVLEQTRAQGYAVTKIPGVNWATMSVPLIIDGAVEFAVSARFHPSAVSVEYAPERFLEPLQHCAQALAEKLKGVDTSW